MGDHPGFYDRIVRVYPKVQQMIHAQGLVDRGFDLIEDFEYNVLISLRRPFENEIFRHILIAAGVSPSIRNDITQQCPECDGCTNASLCCDSDCCYSTHHFDSTPLPAHESVASCFRLHGLACPVSTFPLSFR